ncbi:sodium:alanine symporter family protein [Oscillibacter sp. 1-3]|uniref:alanine/glycine:cation symporter family protein n=1 Tax=Oscillibacter sp. 1-3 TaxID=1235797 RepID=UPI00033DF0CF|nr:amino acid carrier protein [Oscillibacter sp. 1-3]EOS65948.1 amino acid carrier protein [Oscillibacter sp. 1-3]
MVMEWLRAADDLLWGPGTLALLVGTGAFLTLRTRFLPWRNLGYALRAALGREARVRGRDGDVTPFASLMTALAATIGTGNIVGVATALVAGGPGALVWMELAALPGLSTKLAECLLAVKFRRRNRRGEMSGGPMYVMRDGLGRPGAVMGAAYALFAVCSSFGIGGMAQANSIAGALEASFGVPVRITGLVTAGLALAVILGGVKSVARASAAVVPVMAALYLGAALAVLWGCRENLPAGIVQILRCAVSPRAAAGGAAGTLMNTVRWGVARGVFSNEAGMGSAGISAASAATTSPARQGYIGMTGAFFDTCVVCTVTGLAICCSGVLGTADAAGNAVDGAALTILAFRSVLGPAGGLLVSVSIVLFAFTSILGGAYQGEKAFEYLFGTQRVLLYRLAFVLAAAWGAAAELEAVFRFSDICNALMCLPNLLCLLLLSGLTARELEAFQPEVRRRRKT